MRRPQFSMKSLLWLMLVIAVALAIFDRGRGYERGKLASERAVVVYERQAVERAKRVLDVEREDRNLRRLKPVPLKLKQNDLPVRGESE